MAFDDSEYRADTYGAPDFYCDCTRSLASNGDGSLGDPWNLNQAMASAIAGNVVGFIPVADGAQANPVDMAAPNDHEVPAFQPANSGTGDAIANRIVFVTKYAAVALSSVATNGNRTELRHAGTPAAATGDTETGTGGPTYGGYQRDFITYDGFFVDMQHAEIKSDGGVITTRETEGITCCNFEIKGKTTNCQSNAVLYRPQSCTGTILRNFRAYDFSNDPTGSNVQQAGLFSDQYGDQNFLIEHFEIDNIDMGIFMKGTAPNGFNYGTIQYGIVSDCASPFRFNDLHATEMSYVRYCLAYNTIGDRPKPLSPDGIVWDVISSSPRNLTIDHCTIAKIDSADMNVNAALFVEGTDFSMASGVVITNNIFDMDNGSNGHQVALGDALPDTMNHNFYYKNGGSETYVYNGSQHNSFGAWQGAISGRDANSAEGSSSPFNDRTNDDYTINTGHAAYTMSSTGGEVGCYAGSDVIGVDVTASSSSPSATGNLALFLR